MLLLLCDLNCARTADRKNGTDSVDWKPVLFGILWHRKTTKAKQAGRFEEQKEQASSAALS